MPPYACLPGDRRRKRRKEEENPELVSLSDSDSLAAGTSFMEMNKPGMQASSLNLLCRTVEIWWGFEPAAPILPSYSQTDLGFLETSN